MRHALVAVLCVLPAWAGGDTIDNFTLEDLSGKKHTLKDHKDAKAVVLFFVDTECPNVNRYVGRMNELHKTWSGKGVVFFAINSNLQEPVEAIRKHAEASGFPFPVLLDRDQKVADQLRIRTIPETVVIDGTRKVRYRGTLDDNKTEGLAKKKHVNDALEAILAGKDVALAETAPVGCVLQRPLKEQKDATITYSNRVAQILYNRCTSCHRPGQIGPFPLTTYEHARKWAGSIKAYTQSKTMPPWKPVNHGMFKDERWMSQEEIDAVAKWVDSGAPLGEADKVPPPPKFAEGWMLGEPDLVLTAPEYDLEAEGDDVYRCFVLPTDLPEDKWIAGVEMHPGNYRVVHHIIGYVDTSGRAEKMDARDAKPGYEGSGTGPGFIPSGEMSGWAPGNFGYFLPDGVGRKLKKGARVVLEVHYHKNGRKEKDRTQIGLYFAKKPVEKQLRWMELINYSFRIPAGDKRHKVTARLTVGEDVHARAIMPHMHLIGREVTVEAEFPDKTKKILVQITDWDFNWQDTYQFKEPLALPKGTKLTATVYYDNSEGNPNNPNSPPRAMGWGEQTTDEMCITFVAYTRDSENLTKD